VQARSRDDILETLRTLLRNEFDLNGIPLAPASRLVDDLDLDSIDAINMAVRLEQETGLSLKEEELRSVQTIQDVVDVVHRKLQAAAGTDPS
jgi:acyl carrier protein